MPVRLYALLTWTTLRRLPLIHPGAGAFLRRILPEIARRHGTRVVDLGIVRNHVHVVLDLPPNVDIAATRSRTERRERAHCQPRRRDAPRAPAMGEWIRLTIIERARCEARGQIRPVAVDKTPGARLGARPLRARIRPSLVRRLRPAFPHDVRRRPRGH